MCDSMVGCPPPHCWPTARSLPGLLHGNVQVGGLQGISLMGFGHMYIAVRMGDSRRGRVCLRCGYLLVRWALVRRYLLFKKRMWFTVVGVHL